jgi:PAS domain S-box-containing protein/putative nucleotidyltransferase with HDIG domain
MSAIDIATDNKIGNLVKSVAQDPTMTVILNRDGTVFYANKAMGKFLRYKPEEMVGKNWFENFIPATHRKQVLKIFQSVISDDILPVERYINPVITAYGGERVVYWQNSLVRDEQGKIICIVSYGRDITERGQLEEALLLSEKDKNKILNSLTDSVIYQDIDYRIIWANEAAGRGINEKPENMIGHRCYQVIQKRDRPCAACPVTMARTTGQFYELDDTNYMGRIFHLRAYPVFGENREITGVIEVSTDITEKRNAQKKLEESQHKYHLVADNVADIIVVFDMDLNVTYVSPSATAVFGFDYDELYQLDMKNAFPNEQFRTVIKILREALSNASNKPDEMFPSQTITVDAYKKDHSLVPLEARMSFLRDEKGVPIGILGVARDISERKQAEHELLQSYRKLEQALESSVESMAVIGEMRDPYTAGHQRRVTQLAVEIARALKFSPEKIDAIRIASKIHDIGKIVVPAEILSKPVKLTELEFNMIKNHPKMGYDILKTIEFPYPVAEIVYQHHERLDGSGYPRGLKGSAISDEASVLMVADVVEAMASHRPYRPALGIDIALQEVTDNKDILYDKNAVDACVVLFREKNFSFV